MLYKRIHPDAYNRDTCQIYLTPVWPAIFQILRRAEWNPAEWNLKVMVVQNAGGIDKLDRRVELHILKMDKPK
jgi:hypothetical protein